MVRDRAIRKKSVLRETLVFVTLVISTSVYAADFTGQVVGVLDGDTIEILHNQHPERIRLYGIDCPEKRQAFGQRAKQATSRLVFGKDVALQSRGKDKYGRTIAGVLLPDGTDVNQALVKEGWCWWYQKYAPKDMKFQQVEEDARRQRKGLWADPKPVPPWLYRRQQSEMHP